MSLYLDSASADDARAAAQTGLCRGVTTNPTLIARAGLPAEAAIAALCDAIPGTIFYQLTAPTPVERDAEAARMVALHPERIALKIPCTPENLVLCARLAGAGYTCGVTAIFSAAQCWLAVQAGARYVLPYVNRATRQLHGSDAGLALVSAMRDVIDRERGATTEILAASIKSPDEAAATVRAGAHHLTLPWELIGRMGQHPLSDQAIAEFARASPR